MDCGDKVLKVLSISFHSHFGVLKFSKKVEFRFPCTSHNLYPFHVLRLGLRKLSLHQNGAIGSHDHILTKMLNGYFIEDFLTKTSFENYNKLLVC